MPTEDSGFKKARSLAVIKAAAEKYGWDARPAPKPIGTGNVLTGRGIAYGVRNQTIAVEIAEVEVNRTTGRVWVKRFVVAHDCGLVVNPAALKRTLENGLLHSLSRSLYEEVTFDEGAVTSRDWRSYPILTMADIPEIKVVILPHPEVGSYGGGSEAANALAVSAIAAAFFDATGKPARRLPLKAEYVQTVLNSGSGTR